MDSTHNVMLSLLTPSVPVGHTVVVGLLVVRGFRDAAIARHFVRPSLLLTVRHDNLVSVFKDVLDVTVFCSFFMRLKVEI